MERTPFFAAALLLAAPALAFAGKKQPPQSVDAPQGSALIEQLKTSTVDKKRFEAYVKRRIAKLNDAHKSRMDFMAKESDTWNSFWTKVRDERRVFEIRMSRQMLDFFDSLSSIAPGDRDAAISDFEKMQGNVLGSFESQQRQKLDEFFGARDRRWKDFVAQQEQERSQFLADAPADWQRTRQSAVLPGEDKSGSSDDQVKDAPSDGSN